MHITNNEVNNSVARCRRFDTVLFETVRAACAAVFPKRARMKENP